ncbi:MAG: ABC transporter ATP-binding protein [Sphingobacteriales bacterium 41-5]|nr:MAG: ABC transporter ATP-binding protein [Sphingobacteriales bacterium 41-5]
MMIALADAGKRYNRDWIFRQLNFKFENGNSYAITGTNGSGKSTLLQALSGAISLSEGICRWEIEGKEIKAENVYRYVSICAPYLELVEEMTLEEFISFHSKFKPLIQNISVKDIVEETGLHLAGNKKISQFSSGMKQRVKLAQCVLSDVPLVLLDEPCTNLDTAGIEMYHNLIKKYCSNRLVIVSSNDMVEYRFCNQAVNIQDYK